MSVGENLVAPVACKIRSRRLLNDFARHLYGPKVQYPSLAPFN